MSFETIVYEMLEDRVARLTLSRPEKLNAMSPQLLGMFIGQKKIHPLLEHEAKQMLMKSGSVPRRVVRQKL